MTQAEPDEQLAAEAGELLGPRHPTFAVARIGPSEVRLATRGADPGADFEIGSITKGLTGLLYVDALARGEVAAGATLGDHLPLGGAPVAAVTLASLSTHRSGLPGLPRSAHPLRRTLTLWRRGTNPYGEDLAQLLDQARGVAVGRPRPRYSNLGFQLLGHAVAAAAGTTYAALVADRLAGPLGLRSVHVPATPGELRPRSLVGRSRRGAVREPWTGEAVGPAGGVRAAIGDMARLGAALLAGEAPGVGALDPVAPFRGGVRIGAGWITIGLAEREITWHNGGTGGFRSWMGLDRAAGTGVVVLSATALSVDRAGFALLVGRPTRRRR